MTVQNRSPKIERDEEDTSMMYPHNPFIPESLSEGDNFVAFGMAGHFYTIANEKFGENKTIVETEPGSVCIFHEVMQIPLNGLVYGGVIARPLGEGFTETERNEAENLIKLVKKCLKIRNRTQYVWLHEIEYTSLEEVEKRMKPN